MNFAPHRRSVDERPDCKTTLRRIGFCLMTIKARVPNARYPCRRADLCRLIDIALERARRGGGSWTRTGLRSPNGPTAIDAGTSFTLSSNLAGSCVRHSRYVVHLSSKRGLLTIFDCCRELDKRVVSRRIRVTLRSARAATNPCGSRTALGAITARAWMTTRSSRR